MAVLLVISMVISSVFAASRCYWPNGSEAQGYIACRPNAKTSFCCRNQELCLSSGVCLYQDTDSYPSRGACTDRNWDDHACPLFCIASRFSQNDYEDVVVCPGGDNSTGCCWHDKSSTCDCASDYTFRLAPYSTIGTIMAIPTTRSGEIPQYTTIFMADTEISTSTSYIFTTISSTVKSSLSSPTKSASSTLVLESTTTTTATATTTSPVVNSTSLAPKTSHDDNRAAYIGGIAGGLGGAVALFVVARLILALKSHTQQSRNSHLAETNRRISGMTEQRRGISTCATVPGSTPMSGTQQSPAELP